MPGLVPGIHVFLLRSAAKTWMAGTSPATTIAVVFAANNDVL
jgi:hypothetical protein